MVMKHDVDSNKQPTMVHNHPGKLVMHKYCQIGGQYHEKKHLLPQFNKTQRNYQQKHQLWNLNPSDQGMCGERKYQQLIDPI